MKKQNPFSVVNHDFPEIQKWFEKFCEDHAIFFSDWVKGNIPKGAGREAAIAVICGLGVSSAMACKNMTNPSENREVFLKKFDEEFFKDFTSDNE